MINIRIDGRCGNQMFQYAFARTLALEYNEELNISFRNIKRRNDPSWNVDLYDFNVAPFNEVSDMHVTLLQKIILLMYYPFWRFHSRPYDRRHEFEMKWIRFLNYFGIYFLTEGYYPFKKTRFKNKVIIGYYESSKYFLKYDDLIRKEFTPKRDKLKKNKELYKEIFNSESICISIRRGDFVNNANNASVGYICTPTYFEKAINKMNSLVKNPRYVVFSDDITWVKNNMNFPKDTLYESGDDPIYEKMRLMYSCKHFIISNSTFSWWAQHLSRYKKKNVIAPSIWRKYEFPNDIYEKDWVLIDMEEEK